MLVMSVLTSKAQQLCSLVISGAAANVDRKEVKNCTPSKALISPQ